MFSGHLSVRPSVRPSDVRPFITPLLSTGALHLFRVTPYFSTQWRDFNESCHKILTLQVGIIIISLL